jgi:hypothetical protein
MLAFIDERGDTGFKFNSGSTKYFTVSIIYFDQYSEADACDQKIELLKKELKIKKEFKFTSMKRVSRELFLKGSREFRSELKSYLKTKSKLVVHSLKFQDSHRNNLLQLADMIAGSLDRTLTDKSDSKIYRNIIKQKEIAFKIYPPKDNE